MILRLRRTARQFVFAPVHDLSSLTRGHVGTVVASTAAMKLQFADLERAGGEIVGTEWAHHIVDASPNFRYSLCVVIFLRFNHIVPE